MLILEEISKVLSRNCGAKLKFQGSQQDRRQWIILSSLPEILAEAIAQKNRGDCDHGVGHVRFFDWEG